MTEFERRVLADLAELKTNMKFVIGNGRPGRLSELEQRVAEHERTLQRAGGLAAAGGVLLTLAHVGIHYFRR
jgi:hypothetical protein